MYQLHLKVCKKCVRIDGIDKFRGDLKKKASLITEAYILYLVEMKGFEPSTSALRTPRSPS